MARRWDDLDERERERRRQPGAEGWYESMPFWLMLVAFWIWAMYWVFKPR